MRVKQPGDRFVGEDVELIATHQTASEMAPYERLLGDAMKGDQALFASEDAIEAQWKIVDPVLAAPAPVHEYQPATWGPAAADALTEEFGGWINPKASTK
jgi:glucose-6-phosphate 1-dehydrogenase